MGFSTVDGSKLFMSTGFAAAKTVTTISNAAIAAASAVAHGYATNDEVLLASDWEDATDTVWRVNNTSADVFGVQGLDSQDVNWFPAGGGAGTAKKVSGWVEMPQWMASDSQGGDAKTIIVELLNRRNAIPIQAGFNATTITLGFAWDPVLAGYLAMVGASRTQSLRAFKWVLNGGGVGYGYGQLSVNEMPKLQKGQVNQVTAGLALRGRFIGY